MTVVVIGGTSGIGLAVAAHYAALGRPVVLSGRDAARAAAVAAELGGDVSGIAVDLAQPDSIGDRLASLPAIQHLVLAAIDRDHNTAAEYDLKRASYLVTLKLVGYTEVIHTLLPRMAPDSSVVLFGGQAKERPYPGSTTVSTINGGVVGMVHTLASELAPIRVNGIHPGIVGDSPMWRDNEQMIENVTARTPIGRPVTMAEIVGASRFLLQNGGVNGVDLQVDGGWMLL